MKKNIFLSCFNFALFVALLPSIMAVDLSVSRRNPALDHRLQRKLASLASIDHDISFLIADIKYSEGDLKICEFGEGQESRFEIHDMLFGNGLIWSYVWDDLAHFRIPLWYVGPSMRSQFDREEIAFKQFLAIDGKHVKSVKSCSGKLTQGLGIFRHLDSSQSAIQNLRKGHPKLTIMNTATAPFVNNKYFTNVLFDEPDLHMFKPKFVVCEKKYHKNLASEIKKALPCERYVIKPLAEFKGRGVVIVEQEKLDSMLYKLLYEYAVLHAGEPAQQKNESEGHWKRDIGKHFLVEEYCPSKLLTIQGKQYDATMRVVFTMYYHQGVVDVHYLDAYWKVPHHAVTDHGDLTSRYKSFGLNPAKATKKEKQDVFALFDQMLPRLYSKMILAVNQRSVMPLNAADFLPYSSRVHPNAYHDNFCR